MEYYPFDDLAVNYTAGCEVEDDLYFSCNIFNGLFKYNKKTNEMTHLGIFEGEPVLKTLLHQRAFIRNNKIIFVPGNAKKLAIYDIYAQRIEYVKIHEWPRCAAIDSFVDDNQLWIFYSFVENGIICIDLETMAVKTVRLYSELFEASFLKEKSELFVNCICRRGNIVYMPVSLTNCVLKYNIRNGEYELIDTGIEGLHILAVVEKDNYLYVSGYNNKKIYQYDISKKTVIEYIPEVDFKPKRQGTYPEMVVCSGNVIVFACRPDYVMWLDEKERLIKMLCPIEEGFDIGQGDLRSRRQYFFYHDTSENRVVMYPYCGGKCLVFDGENRILTDYEIKFDKEFIDNLFVVKYEPLFAKEEMKKTIIKESKLFRFEGFLREI